jgi:hypothetical protein
MPVDPESLASRGLISKTAMGKLRGNAPQQPNATDEPPQDQQPQAPASEVTKALDKAITDATARGDTDHVNILQQHRSEWIKRMGGR